MLSLHPLVNGHPRKPTTSETFLVEKIQFLSPVIINISNITNESLILKVLNSELILHSVEFGSLIEYPSSANILSCDLSKAEGVGGGLGSEGDGRR